MRLRLACLAVGLACLGGCGATGADVAAVKSVAKRWLDASDTGDGRTYCDLLAPWLRKRNDAGARQLGPHVTCAESHSTHPPGISRFQLNQIAEDRRLVAAGLRIDTVSVDGSKATVEYSSRAPTHYPESLEYKKPVHGRVHDTLTLVRLKGEWRIG